MKKEFSEATRKPTQNEIDDALLGWYTYDVHTKKKIFTQQETRSDYESVFCMFRATVSDAPILKIERITSYPGN